MYAYLGRGVFATEDIAQGQFVAQYCGDLISGEVVESREQSGGRSAFRYFFKGGQQKFW